MQSIFVSTEKIRNKLYNKHGAKIKSRIEFPLLTLLHFRWKRFSASLPLLLANTKKLYSNIVRQKIRLSCRNISSHIFCGCINLITVIQSKFVLLLQVQSSKPSARQQCTLLHWPNNINHTAFQILVQSYSSNFSFFKCHKTSILL